MGTGCWLVACIATPCTVRLWSTPGARVQETRKPLWQEELEWEWGSLRQQRQVMGLQVSAPGVIHHTSRSFPQDMVPRLTPCWTRREGRSSVFVALGCAQ